MQPAPRDRLSAGRRHGTPVNIGEHHVPVDPAATATNGVFRIRLQGNGTQPLRLLRPLHGCEAACTRSPARGWLAIAYAHPDRRAVRQQSPPPTAPVAPVFRIASHRECASRRRRSPAASTTGPPPAPVGPPTGFPASRRRLRLHRPLVADQTRWPAAGCHSVSRDGTRQIQFASTANPGSQALLPGRRPDQRPLRPDRRPQHDHQTCPRGRRLDSPHSTPTGQPGAGDDVRPRRGV